MVRGWVPLSSKPGAPLGYATATREYGYYSESSSDEQIELAPLGRRRDLASDKQKKMPIGYQEKEQDSHTPKRPHQDAMPAMSQGLQVDQEKHGEIIYGLETRHQDPGPERSKKMEKWLKQMKSASTPRVRTHSRQDLKEKQLLGNHPERSGNPEFEYPPPQDVLATMLLKVEELHAPRYGDYLQLHRDTIKSTIQEHLRSEARSILDSGCYTRESLLQIGIPDLHEDDSGIYLHILWLVNNSDVFWLYVGQSTDLKTRIRDHKDPVYRRKHPCLHYYIWDIHQINPEYEIEETFVYLSVQPRQEHAHANPLFLNLLEMWCCLILQTLTTNALSEYLPEGRVCPRAGVHLNVALPIHQSNRSSGPVFERGTGDIYHTHDPLVRQYYKSLQAQYYDLKNSTDPVIRDYYLATVRRQSMARAVTMQSRSVPKLLEGQDVLVTVSNSYRQGTLQEFSLSYFVLRISTKIVSLNNNTTIRARCDLLADEQLIHPHRFAAQSLESDPAIRLGIEIKGTDRYGQPFRIWLTSNGKRKVMQMNTFVDLLTGRNILEGTEKLPRRYIIPRQSGGRTTYSFDPENDRQRVTELETESDSLTSE